MHFIWINGALRDFWGLVTPAGRSHLIGLFKSGLLRLSIQLDAVVSRLDRHFHWQMPMLGGLS